MKAIPINWVVTKKTNAECNVCRCKARLVCKGFIQREGIDFVETFPPAAKFQSMRCLISIAAFYCLNLEQINVVTAFFNPDVEEEIYIQVPQDLKIPEEFKQGAPAVRLLERLYSLKQAPRLWNDAFNATLRRPNHSHCNSDTCLYLRRENSEFVIIAL